MSKEERYQECNPLEKLWRMRHYLKVPFRFVKCKMKMHEDSVVGGNKNLWNILIGTAQCDMKYYWTQEEVMDKLKKITKNER